MGHLCAGLADFLLVEKWQAKDTLDRFSPQKIITSYRYVVAYSNALLDAFQSQVHGFLGVELRYFLPIKIDFTRGGGVSARDNSDQGRLSRSIVPYQTDQLALEKIDADISKRLKVSIGKGNVLNANKRLP